MKNEQDKPQNPVALLRERFRKIKENRKPSKEVEETFTPSKSEKTEEPAQKKSTRLVRPKPETL